MSSTPTPRVESAAPTRPSTTAGEFEASLNVQRQKLEGAVAAMQADIEASRRRLALIADTLDAQLAKGVSASDLPALTRAALNVRDAQIDMLKQAQHALRVVESKLSPSGRRVREVIDAMEARRGC